MKYFAIIFLLIGLVRFESRAQDIKINQSSNFKAPSNFALSLVLANIDLPDNTVLIETNRVNSPFAEHITFQQITNGLRVRFAEVKLHLKFDDTYHIQNNLIYERFPTPESFANSYLPSVKGVVLTNSTKNEDIETFSNIHGEIVMEIDHVKYIRKDTTLFTKVFAVNPIHSSGIAYGDVFTDRNDSTSTALENQMVWKPIQVKYENDSFFLESEYLYFGEIRGPVDTITYENNDTAVYTRDMQPFEKMNAYYHINTIAEYIDLMGHDDLTDTLLVDVHAGFADNSGYRPSLHSLEFGDGGVDDAEDGEVVVHEFAHSLSERASPDNTVGSERTAMEEGTADYFCKSYSQTVSSFFRDQVFSWDGHNEFWAGIDINSSKRYPTDLKGDRNSDRDIWSSALMCVQDFIGKKQADSLVLEHLYYQYANSIMSEMAVELLRIDNVDFDGRYGNQLKQCFVDAGFIVRGVNVPVITLTDDIRVLNHSAFASGSGQLKIQVPASSQFIVYNLFGQKIINSKGTEITLDPSDFSAGMYVIDIICGGSRSSVKIVKY
jgi:hypothetical protein